mgnify:CR=1 FL=1
MCPAYLPRTKESTDEEPGRRDLRYGKLEAVLALQNGAKERLAAGKRCEPLELWRELVQETGVERRALSRV